MTLLNNNKMEATKEKRKLVYFDEVNFDSDVHKLTQRIRFLQSILDAWPAAAGSLTNWKDFTEMLRDPMKFIENRIISRDFSPEISGIPLDAEKIRQFIKLPDTLELQFRIDIAFKSEYVGQFLNYYKDAYDIKDHKVIISENYLAELREKHSKYINNMQDAERLRLCESLVKHYRKMADSGLWPSACFQHPFSLFVNESLMAPNPAMISPSANGFPTGATRGKRQYA